MKSRPRTFEQLLAHWTTLELSADLGVQYVTARKMRERQSVGTQHWPRLVEAAATKGIEITQSDLLDMRNRRVAA